MKYFIIISLFCFSTVVNAQFKEDLNKKIDIKDGITNNQPSQFFLDFIDPSKFTMNHTFSLSYSAMGNQGISLGVYTNSINYQFSENLDFRVDASLVTSPYNTYGENFTNQINGVYLTRAELNYRPDENTVIKLQYYRPPAGTNPFYRSYGYPYWW